MYTKPKRIGIFGGTFDPVHNGHISIAKSFLDSNYIDALWIFLNPAPPHKPDEKFAPYSARFKMLQAAFESVDNATVSDLETRLPKPSFTIQTVSYLTDKYPERTFYLCLGKDSLVSFKSWHKWKQLLNHCTLLVADRPVDKDREIDPELRNNLVFVDHETVDISSTEIREKVKRGEPVDHLVPQSVLSVIEKEKLYTQQK